MTDPRDRPDAPSAEGEGVEGGDRDVSTDVQPPTGGGGSEEASRGVKMDEGEPAGTRGPGGMAGEG